MLIRFIELKIHNFKSHRDRTVKFGDLTKITADNAHGKSSILEAITFSLYGLDTFGSKLDPTPIGYEYDETSVSLLIEVDGKQVLLGRELKKGKTKYYINEVPSKAGEFNEIVDQLFDKELFFSLFNPNYFFTIHWEKQRSMILQYVTAPSNKEVLKELPQLQADKLGELVKKHSLDDLQKIHKANKTKMEKEHIAAQSKTKTLQEQLELLGTIEGNLVDLEKNEQSLRDAIVEADKLPNEAFQKNQEYRKVKSEIDMVQDQIDLSKERWPSLKNEPIKDTCRTCQRPLDEESIKAVESDKKKRITEYKENHQKLVDKKKELQDKLASMKVIDVTEEKNKVRKLEDELDLILEAIRSLKQQEQLHKQIEQAKEDEDYKLTSLKESIFILDAIKDFRAKEAELQGEKVQKLFTTLSTKLFEEQKNGEIKPTFVIQMDGKDYSKLSLSESIRAGLELREVLSEQSNIIAPCFVDNAESITKFKEPSGQLIISRVVAGQELKIKEESK